MFENSRGWDEGAGAGGAEGAGPDAAGGGAPDEGCGALDAGCGAPDAGCGGAGPADDTADEGWAHFSDVCPPPVDPFAPPSTWPNDDSEVNDLSHKMENMEAKFGEMVELTNNLLSAMSCMAPQDIANIVNDNAMDNIDIPLGEPEKPVLTPAKNSTSAPSDVTRGDVRTAETQDSCVVPNDATLNLNADANKVENQVDHSPSASAFSDSPNAVHDNISNESRSSGNDSTQCDNDTGNAGNDTSDTYNSNDTSTACDTSCDDSSAER
ncbi:dentin sialophosphoprotein-like [Zerene cesonia]|uniref:dentin sialophosphoprotein-like n=1 Tax=Zerene cesonia TaxID=33412 RepID=UPI0018E5399D|nr:dentin sialophosphoprotein-like [Zerene cesonia]